jgi:hypothetical protein
MEITVLECRLNSSNSVYNPMVGFYENGNECEILVFHGDEDSSRDLLDCDAV